ncbi:MAG: flagellar biosynthesis protein FlgL [Sphingomonas sp.]|nr:MAG: flagellar biosynthesis protein FlgL [Sphingomonas sp.]
MQISTSQFYDRAATSIASTSAKTDTINTQIASGKKLQAPSDDSVAYQRLAGLSRTTADATSYDANLTMAGSLLQQADTTLTAITTQLQKASELAIQANNGTLNASQRAVIGQQLEGIADTIAGLANIKDLRGQPLFGGADGAAAVTKTADGRYTYAETAPSPIPIGDGQSVQAGETASRVLTFGDKDALGVIAGLAAALQSGEELGTAGATAIDDLSAAGTQVTAMQASLGARAARVDLQQAAQKDIATDREDVRSGIEDTDVVAATVELQKQMTILNATSASFTKLSSLSLFNYLK